VFVEEGAEAGGEGGGDRGMAAVFHFSSPASPWASGPASFNFWVDVLRRFFRFSIGSAGGSWEFR
jgi:hypothetical protein